MIRDNAWDALVAYMSHTGHLTLSQIGEIEGLRPYIEALDLESSPGGALNRPENRVAAADPEAHVRGYFEAEAPDSLREALRAQPDRPLDDVIAEQTQTHPELFQHKVLVRVGPMGSLADILDSEPAAIRFSADRAARHLTRSGVLPRPELRGVLADRGVGSEAMTRLVETGDFATAALSHALRFGLNVDYRLTDIGRDGEPLAPFRDSLYDVAKVSAYHLPRYEAAMSSRAAAIQDTSAYLRGGDGSGRLWPTDEEVVAAYPRTIEHLRLSEPDWVPASTYGAIRAAQDHGSRVELVDTTNRSDVGYSVPLEPSEAFPEVANHLPPVERSRLAARFGIKVPGLGGELRPVSALRSRSEPGQEGPDEPWRI